MVKKAQEKLTILGLDSGSTKGYAVLDLEGNIIDLKSFRNFGLNKSLEFTFRLGKPLIIGSDVRPAPKFVERFASNLGAKLNVPIRNMNKFEKVKLTKKYIKNTKYKIKDKHQRDALLAAIIAYRKCRRLFDKIDSKLNKLNMQQFSDKIKQDVLINRVPIKKAIKKIK